MTSPPVLLRAVRDGVVESVHTGTMVVTDVDGAVVSALGDPGLEVYVRSAVKPLQALASLVMLGSADRDLDGAGLAIACASHDGSDDQQIEAARLLAEAELDESALQCPPALPRDLATLLSQRTPQRLAHNCSGKHAAFLYASVAIGADPAKYLQPVSALQRRIREVLSEVCGAAPQGPGTDGCGAPAWRLPLSALATGFARLAQGASPPLRQIRQAMTGRPDLVGGPGASDTELMRADATVVAKRGAEAVLAAGIATSSGPLGVAVKITDGGMRADGPVMAAVLEALGAQVPAAIRHPAVLGGGRPHGSLDVDDAVAQAVLAGAR